MVDLLKNKLILPDTGVGWDVFCCFVFWFFKAGFICVSLAVLFIVFCELLLAYSEVYKALGYLEV